MRWSRLGLDPLLHFLLRLTWRELETGRIEFTAPVLDPTSEKPRWKCLGLLDQNMVEIKMGCRHLVRRMHFAWGLMLFLF